MSTPLIDQPTQFIDCPVSGASTTIFLGGDIDEETKEYLLKQELIGVDTETRGLVPQRDRLCTVQLATQEQQCFIVRFPGTSSHNLSEVFSSSVIKICHYARFDLGFLEWHLQGAGSFKNFHCTKIMSKLLRTYGVSHSLKTVCEEILDMPMDKKEQTAHDWASPELTPEQIVYAAKDALVLPALYDKLLALIEREDEHSGVLTLMYNCFIAIPTVVDLELSMYKFEEVFGH